jgi:taurine dioxygenase
MQIEPVTPTIGATVRGVDLRRDLDDATIAAIRAALLEHLVLFFRDQHLDDERHLAFALRFGTLNLPPLTTAYQRTPAVTVLDQANPKGEGADQWHSDNSFMANPPLGSILRCVRLPEGGGGDTCFASAYAAYEALPPPLQQLADGLTAVHDITKSLTKAIAAGHTELDLADTQKRWPPVTHPVVIRHPETGRRALYVNRSSTTRIVGLDDRQSEALLSLLCDQFQSPDIQCRFRWEPGSVAFWDNRSVQHYAVADYRHRRVMHRVTIDAAPRHRSDGRAEDVLVEAEQPHRVVAKDLGRVVG